MRSTNKFRYYFGAVSALCIFAGISYFYFFGYGMPHCLRLRSGTASLTIHYTDRFMNASYRDFIRIKRRISSDPTKPSDEDYVIGVDTQPFETVDNIVKYSQGEAGPKYQKTKFNGHEAAIARYGGNKNFGSITHVKVPMGDTLFYIFFITGTLSSDDLTSAYAMLQSIAIRQEKEHFSGAQVEQCRV